MNLNLIFYQIWLQSLQEARFINQNRTELKNLKIYNSEQFYEFSTLITCIVRACDEVSDECLSYEEFKKDVKMTLRKIKLECHL